MANIIDSGNRFGNMNGSCFSGDFTKEEKKKLFWEHRKLMGKAYGFDPHKMFMADQKDKSGSYFEITEDYVNENPNGWTDISEDILIITDKVPGVVIGHPVADCPVVMVEDVKNGAVAVAHCSADLIDKHMPYMAYQALKEAYDSNDDNIIAFVSACAGSEWKYDQNPKFATDSHIWDGAIIEENGVFKIDVRKAIKKQLTGLDIRFNYDDTITNPNYYSNSAASPYGGNDQTKYGRNFAGVFYQDDSLSIENNSDIKKFIK